MMAPYLQFAIVLFFSGSVTQAFQVSHDLSYVQQNQALLQEFAEFKNRISVLENIAKRVTDFEAMYGDLEEIGQEIMDLRQHKEKIILSENKDINTNLSSHNGRTDTVPYEEQAWNIPAFTVGIQEKDLNNLGPYQTIIFKGVITNAGNHYSPHTGIFRAPFKGVYAFNLVAMENAYNSIYLEIVRDSKAVNELLIGGEYSKTYLSQSKLWVLELEKYSEVWVRTIQAGGDIHGYMHTLFSGWLLYFIRT